MSPQALLEKLASISTDGQMPPEGIGLANFIEWSGLGGLPHLKQSLQELELLGYIKIERSSEDQPKKILIKKSKWDSKIRLESEPSHQPTENRRFVVLIDYKNLEDSIKNPGDRFRNFSWLLDPILEQGILIFGFVFIPEHYSARPAINQLSSRHRFSPILCPRQFDGIISKDADTVDARMNALGKDLIEHSDCTDLVIISGDRDFQELANFAIWRKKKIHVFSTPEALSNAFRQIEGSRLEVHLINP